MRICLPWGTAFAVLFLYYNFIQFPMERSFTRGLEDLHEGSDARAQEEFHKILKTYPDYEPVYFNLGYMYCRYGLPEEAKKNFREARLISFVSSSDLSERGSVYFAWYGAKQRENFFNKKAINGYLWNILYAHNHQ